MASLGEQVRPVHTPGAVLGRYSISDADTNHLGTFNFLNRSDIPMRSSSWGGLGLAVVFMVPLETEVRAPCMLCTLQLS